MADSTPPGGRSDRSGNGAGIDSTPTAPRPPNELVELAVIDIPTILADVQPIDGVIELVASHLAKKMRGAGHNLATAQWAIHEAVQAGRLRTELVSWAPQTGRRVGGERRFMGGPDDRRIEWSVVKQPTFDDFNGKPVPFESFKVIATELLWEWWRSRSLPETDSASTPATETTPQVKTMDYETIKARLCEFMQTRFLDRSSTGAARDFTPSELLSTEHGFTEIDKRLLIRAFEELRIDGLISFGMVEMPTLSKEYEPWFNSHRRLTILGSVLKVQPRPKSEIDESSCRNSSIPHGDRQCDLPTDTKPEAIPPKLLVTRKQIAKAVHLEEKSMTPYSKAWGDPEVPHGGKRPAKWDLNRILPILRKQFESVKEGDWNELKGTAEQS